MGGTEKFVGRIKFANWGCKKKGNLNKVQGGAGLPFEEESRRKATQTRCRVALGCLLRKNQEERQLKQDARRRQVAF